MQSLKIPKTKIIVSLISGFRLLVSLVLIILATVANYQKPTWPLSPLEKSEYNITHPSLSINLIIFALILIAGISDIFDGYLARKWKVTSWFGYFFDNLGDRCFGFCVFITLTAIGCLPKWAPAVWIMREVSANFFIGISPKFNQGRNKIARPIELIFFVWIFWINGKNRFVHVNQLTRQLLWLPFYELILFSVVKFGIYCYVQWPLCRKSLQTTSETKWWFVLDQKQRKLLHSTKNKPRKVNF